MMDGVGRVERPVKDRKKNHASFRKGNKTRAKADLECSLLSHQPDHSLLLTGFTQLQISGKEKIKTAC